jgi:pimeloyl-ACP methyl ester carboxylesterase
VINPVLFPDDRQFWYETQRVLGHSSYGGADSGEVLATAQQIVASDYDSWYDAWVDTADRIADEADVSLKAGHRVTARDGLLRASTYYRTAEFFLHGDPGDPRVEYSYSQAVSCFQAAVALFETPVTPVQIPYDDTVLHGYFYSGGSGVRPTVVMHNGFDGSAEEMHFFGAAAAVERGYHVLTFDGPGQPAARRLDGLVFRPDWEHPVAQVLDWLCARPDVDADRVAILGASMGGLLAVRAAAFEPRLGACIAFDGVYDLGVISVSELPLPRDQAEAVLRAEHAPEADAAIEEVMARNPTARWALTHGAYVMGVDSPRAFLASYLDYSLVGIAERVACPTLICEAEDDDFFAGQPREVFDHLRAPRTLLRFAASEGAGAHCQSGAQRLAFGRIFDWLADTWASHLESELAKL